MKYIAFLFLFSLLIFQCAFAQDIHDAVEKNDVELVKALLQKDPNLTSVKNERGYSPLHIAAYGGNIEIAKVLLQYKADLDAKDLNDNRPLHLAIFGGHLEMVKFLLEAGADINADAYGTTPIILAIQRTRKEIVDYLLDGKVKWEQYLESGEITIHNAARSGSRKLVDLIIAKGISTETKSPTGDTFLHSATTGGMKNYVEIELKKGTDPNSRNNYGKTPLHSAAATGNTDIAGLLLDKGADVNLKNLGGHTAYNYASQVKNEEMMKLLATRGAGKTEWIFPVIASRTIDSNPPELKPRIFAPGIISTEEGFEFASSFSPDGTEIYFTRRLPKFGQKIYYMKYKNGSWSMPAFAPFSYDCQFEFEPFVAPDGKRVFWGSKRPLPGSAELNERSNIWYSDRTAEGWGEPKFLDKEMMFVTSSLSGTIFFTGIYEKPLLVGLYYRAWDGKQYGDPIALPDYINKLKYVAHPYIAPDESYVLYDAHIDDKNHTKIFISFKKKENSWTEPMSLEELNVSNHLMTANVTPDGKYIFFHSGGDIYWISARILEKYKKLALEK